MAPRFSKICTWLIQGAAAQFVELIDPHIDDQAQLGNAHARNRQVMARRKAAYAAQAALAVGDQQITFLDRDFLRIWQQGREIVVENEGRGVVRILFPACTRISGTEIAGWVIVWRIFERSFLYFALPGPLRAVRRDEHPFARERVEAPVWSVPELVELHRVLSDSIADGRHKCNRNFFPAAVTYATSVTPSVACQNIRLGPDARARFILLRYGVAHGCCGLGIDQIRQCSPPNPPPVMRAPITPGRPAAISTMMSSSVQLTW